MNPFGRTNTAVFMSPDSIGSRQGFSERRLKGIVNARANSVVRLQHVPGNRSAGPQLRVTGVLSVRGPQARLTFRRGNQGRIDSSIPPLAEDRELLPAGTAFPVREVLVPCRDAEPPVVWVAFMDHEQAVLSSPVCVGRVRREATHVDPLFELPALANTWLSARRNLRTEAELHLSGELVIPGGIVLRLTLASGRQRNGDPGGPLVNFDLTVVARGASVPFAEHSVSPAVRDRPFVSMTLRDWGGRDVGVEEPVGWLSLIR